MPRKPLVGLPADRTPIGRHPFQAVGEKYIRAVMDGMDAIPVLIPSLSPTLPLRDLLLSLDGLFLTGSHSNIDPGRYGGAACDLDDMRDPSRDESSLALVPLAIEMGVPVLAVCRGMQEVNVALGGTLHPKVQEVPGFQDHREDEEAPLDEQYGPAHVVCLDGGLAQLAGGETALVNSLHGQGINRLGRGLRIEAIAPDGLVEAVRLGSNDSYLLAVQWHPEWKLVDNPFYLSIFQEFAAACRARAGGRA